MGGLETDEGADRCARLRHSLKPEIAIGKIRNQDLRCAQLAGQADRTVYQKRGCTRRRFERSMAGYIVRGPVEVFVFAATEPTFVRSLLATSEIRGDGA